MQSDVTVTVEPAPDTWRVQGRVFLYRQHALMYAQSEANRLCCGIAVLREGTVDDYEFVEPMWEALDLDRGDE